MAKKLDK
jgi:hypothetical protein